MKSIEVSCDPGHLDTLESLAEHNEITDIFTYESEDKARQLTRLLVEDDQLQTILDALQKIRGSDPGFHIMVYNIESAITLSSPNKEPGKKSRAISREALYQVVASGTGVSIHYLLLIMLSTLVAAIGLIENNVAVLIGAMVIAPLLGPNLAFSVGTALADTGLIRRSIVSLMTGILLAFTLSYLTGLYFANTSPGPALLERTQPGFDSIALALASGAAAALSLSTGVSTVLVGVMVSVALLPPVASMGILFGMGQPHLAMGAGTLLAINIVCVNLSAKLVLLAQGIKPRTSSEKNKARKSLLVYLVAWLAILLLLVLLILANRQV